MSNMRWKTEKVNEWYEGLPWLVGCNFIPSTAINQLEMWQADKTAKRRWQACDVIWYMARTQGSLFEKCLPVFRAENVGCFNW